MTTPIMIRKAHDSGDIQIGKIYNHVHNEYMK